MRFKLIRADEEVTKFLDKKKIHPRVTYNEVLRKLLKIDKPEKKNTHIVNGGDKMKDKLAVAALIVAIVSICLSIVALLSIPSIDISDMDINTGSINSLQDISIGQETTIDNLTGRVISLERNDNVELIEDVEDLEDVLDVWEDCLTSNYTDFVVCLDEEL